MLKKEQSNNSLDIVYEDDDLLVINKPPGIAVHPSTELRASPAEDSKKITLIDAILAHDVSIKKVGEDPLRPGIVHRIDADTSGILVVAKNQRTFLWLKKQFASREVEKQYLAIVKGRIKAPKGILKGQLGRVGGKFKLIEVEKLRPHEKVPEKTRDAETEFRVLRRFQEATLVLLSPKTGRTHQLRVQLSAFGYPILGDKLYGSKEVASLAPRQMLHATRLTVSMPEDRRISFEADPPEDFQEVLNNLIKEDEELKISKNEEQISYE